MKTQFQEMPRPFTTENPENRYICEENLHIFPDFQEGIKIVRD